MKLYYASSVCSLAVRIIIHELGIACDYEAVNLKTKQTETGADFLTINPKGAVPALRLTNDEILTENAVILQYLADIHQATELLPPVGEMKRYRILEWLNFVATDLHRYCAPLFWSVFPADIKENVFTPILKKKLAIVEEQLKHHSFLLGGHLTLGDSYLFVILVWLEKLKTNMEEWPHLLRYFNQMKQRKTIQRALAEEGLIASPEE
jgi:glutathione S-transferase